MYFVILCMDRPNCEHIRAEHRPAHLAFFQAHKEQVVLAGPFMGGADHQAMIGSMLIVDAVDEDSVRALMAQEPFTQIGLFDSVDIKPWRWTHNAPAAIAR